MNHQYHCTWNPDDWYQVTLNGATFDTAPSLAIRNHSPDGFSWGYAGSGPAQLALAILLQETDDKDFAERHYMVFKRAFVMGLRNEQSHAFDSEALRPYIEAYRQVDIDAQQASDEIGNTKIDRSGR